MYTVYLVDDDQLSLDKLLARRMLFLESGFRILGAQTDPVKALEEIREEKPDAVLSDLKMPVMTGNELFEHISYDEHKPLFVIISAYNEFKEVRKFFLSYGFDYLLKPIEDLQLTGLLNRISYALRGNLPISLDYTKSKKLNAIIGYVEEFSHMTHTLETIGDRFSLSPGAICNLFSRHLNTTFSTYVNELRAKKAERLLVTTHKSVKEVAAICGYTDAFYFTRVFKETHGLSPTHYRLSKGWTPEGAKV